jgi:serine/threonine-protein kinase HipA
MSGRILSAWWEDGTRIGQFIERDDGTVRLAYRDGYDGIPLSVSLGIESEATPRAAFNFLANLLPESESARARIARPRGLDPNDHFGLLGEIGRECAGALILAPDDEPPPAWPGQYRPLDDAEFERWLEMRDLQPLMTDPEGRVRLSLAGAQAKAALHFDVQNQPSMPLDGAASTHIIKPSISRAHPNTVYLEWFCMQLAASMLTEADVANTDLWRRCLRVARFDRRATDRGIRRLHQEDLCQALALAPTAKYERLNGLDDLGESLLARISVLIDELGRAGRMSVPALQKQKLYRYVLTNVMLLNADAHLKNFALLHSPNGQSQLAPLYDVLCTKAIRLRAGNETGWDRDEMREVAVESELALAIGTARTVDAVGEDDCITCATQQLGLTARYAQAEYRRMKTRLIKAIPAVQAQLTKQHPPAEPAIAETASLLLAHHN